MDFPSFFQKGIKRSIHVEEAELTIVVKDINDNVPVFPNATMFGDVQENGPIGESSCFPNDKIFNYIFL